MTTPDEAKRRNEDQRELRSAGLKGHKYFVCIGPLGKRYVFIESAGPETVKHHLKEADANQQARAYVMVSKGRFQTLA